MEVMGEMSETETKHRSRSIVGDPGACLMKCPSEFYEFSLAPNLTNMAAQDLDFDAASDRQPVHLPQNRCDMFTPTCPHYRPGYCNLY